MDRRDAAERRDGAVREPGGMVPGSATTTPDASPQLGYANVARVSGILLSPVGGVLTASTWLTPIQFASKPRAEPAM